MKKLIYTLSVIILLLLAVSGCQNPMLGLGPAADIETPSGAFSLYENGDYVRGEISLEGISSDDVKIESVRAILDTEVHEAELTDGQITYWSIPIDTTEYADGEYTIILMITDSSGRATEKRLLLYFDNTPPTVLVTSTVGITSGAATNFPIIRGEAYDYHFSRIDKLEAEVVSGNAEILSLQGSNGWSMTVQTTGTGEYSIAVTAYDTAGNANEWLYHSSDFPSGTKIEDIANAEDLGSLGAQALAPLRRSSQDIEVDLSLDEPQVVISNPEEGKTAEDNILGGTASAVGYIEDDDEVDTDTIQLSLDGGASWQQLTGTQLSGSGGFIRWNYDLSSLDNGVYNLQVKANDTGKPAGDSTVTGYSATVPFTIDKTAPSVTITSPEPGTYLGTGDFEVTGTASDTGGSINSLRISINGAAFENVSISPGENIVYSYDITGAASGALSIKVEAVDDSGKTSFYSQQVYVDTVAPSIEFLSPAAGLYINGTASLQGVSSDNWSLQQVKVQIGGSNWDSAAAETLPPSEFYSWQRDIVSSNYENSGMATEVNGSGIPEVGTGIWELKIWAEAEDRAGNVTLGEHKIYIDNSLDRPGINISSPADNSVMAGSVILSGSAWDDSNEPGEALDHVEIRVWKGQPDGSDGHIFADRFDLNDLLGLDDVYGDDSWYKVAGTSTWQTELNAGGEFYPDSGHDGTVKIDVRAVDQKSGVADLAGNMQSIEVTFDDTVPYFSGLSHSSSEYERGTFDLTGTVNDDDSVVRLRISYNGGVDWTVIDTNMGTSSPFSHSIDSNALVGSSGILYLRLEALDTANYKTLTGINLNIDNMNPGGSYTGSITDLSGTARVQGTAFDIGTISRVNRIEVSFTLDGTAVNPLSSKGTRIPIVIDSATEAGNDDWVNGDDDGYDESMTLDGSTWTWWADFDSTSLDDGVLEVIYTVYDAAGNSYTQTVSGGNIKNHAPEITSVVAGWDHDHDGSIDTSETEPNETEAYEASTTEVNSIYGNLSYSFNVDYDNLNGELDYSIRTRPLPAGIWTDYAAAALSGTLDTTLTSIFAGGDGDYEIEFKVTDTKNYESTLILTVTLENSDSEDPVMNFYELTAANAAAVKSAETGHIEIDTNTYLSGLIPFSGRAEDNQRIQSISYSINSAAAVEIAVWDSDDGQLEYVSDNTPLEAGSGFIDDSGELKHRANWAYEWDSASLPAGLGTTVEFIVTDAAGRTNSVTRTYDVVPYISSVDTMLSSSYSSTLARSAKGRYPVLIDESATTSYETVTVHGWNLDSSDASTTEVRLSGGTDPLAAGSISLSFTGGGDDSDALSVDLDSTGSGYLTVIVDGVSSRNNANSDDSTNHPYNFEDSDVHQSLSDDRFFSVWDITRLWESTTDMNHAEYPTMTVNAGVPHFTYVNNAEGFGQAFYFDGSANKTINKNWDLFTYTALDFNDEGEHGALVDVNVVHGYLNTPDAYNSGNYGGIYINFFYDTPSHIDQNLLYLDYGLWLENLADTTVPYTAAVLDRYQYPDLVLEGSNDTTDVFYSVYDTLEQQLIFRYFQVGTNSGLGSGGNGKLTDAVSGDLLYTDVEQEDRSGNWPDYSSDKRFDNYGPGATPPGAHVKKSDDSLIFPSATEFSAVAASPDGAIAMLAYYDTSGSGQLVFMYNSTPDVPDGWSAPIKVDDFVGAEYIDMKVDLAGHIHIAYYDSLRGDVKYAYLPSYLSHEDTDDDGGSTDNNDVDVYTVDSYLIIGSKLTLDVYSADATSIGTPFISYKSTGNSARAAWLTGVAGSGAVNDEFTGTWEIQTVPNLISDSDSNRFNIGVDNNVLPIVGYTDDGLEYVRLLPELTE